MSLGNESSLGIFGFLSFNHEKHEPHEKRCSAHDWRDTRPLPPPKDAVHGRLPPPELQKHGYNVAKPGLCDR